MSAILSPEIHTALTQLLHGLQSPDNVLRSEAEQRLQDEWSNPQPGLLLVGLVEQLQGADDVAVCPQFLSNVPSFNTSSPQTRSFAAVLFRRVASRNRKDPSSTDSSPRMKEIFLTLEPNQREVIRTKLLQSLASETNTPVRNKVSDAVAEVARQYTEDGRWNPLYAFSLRYMATNLRRKVLRYRHKFVKINFESRGLKTNGTFDMEIIGKALDSWHHCACSLTSSYAHIQIVALTQTRRAVARIVAGAPTVQSICRRKPA